MVLWWEDEFIGSNLWADDKFSATSINSLILV